ncbi:CPBP family intramembrane metalloprotease [Rhodocytophaga rosea]|uniref:CPBP family intramembrane metalloprotease n=2 Tax=Rhodocytophaga rosea TaxID=2704465 RepID=A0A6C0GV19_9BACT|nr:CPBP family intramembrane metalloprotease [Rhodocytophaga rosea]
MQHLDTFYKNAIRRFLQPGWKTGLGFIILLSIPRVFIVLQASLTGNYQYVSILFLVMWVLPFLLLTRAGRKQIGIKRPQHAWWILMGFLLGMACCTIMYWIGAWLFGVSTHQWFVYISGTYTQVPAQLTSNDRLVFFLVYSAISMTFSPVGEELFYRGIVHENFAADMGDTRAAFVDSSAFALVHLAHFGIVYSGQQWQLLYVPAFLWVLFLFGACLVFYISRRKSGSILGAIASHAGFNLAMNYFIFYYIR